MKAEFNRCVSARTQETKRKNEISCCCLVCMLHFPAFVFVLVCVCVYPKLFAVRIEIPSFFCCWFFVFLRLTHSHSQRFMHNNENLCAHQIYGQQERERERARMNTHIHTWKTSKIKKRNLKIEKIPCHQTANIAFWAHVNEGIVFGFCFAIMWFHVVNEKIALNKK